MNSPRLLKPPAPELRNSWERSRRHGLDSSQALPDAPVLRADLTDRLEANARLLTFSRPVIENLYEQIGSPSSTVLLADRHGTILSTVGCPEFLDRAAKVALSAGAQWREADMGTNAIGTALHTGNAVAVHGAEHFLERNRFLACVATPILAPNGGIIGILDVSTDTRANLAHANALLQTTAELIEHRLIETLDDGFLSIHFHARPDLIGSPLEALVVFDEQGQLLASNRTARSMLVLDPKYPFAHCHECFATAWTGLVGWAALRQATPFPIRSARGHTYAARVKLRTTQRSAGTASANTARRVSHLLAMRLGDMRVGKVIDTLQHSAGERHPLLIAGETGSGKSHLVQAFHDDFRSGPDAPLVSLDCTTLSSDADAARRDAVSALQQAGGGHLLLKHVGHLAPVVQAELFRITTTTSRARLIATSPRPLIELARGQRFDFATFRAHGGRAVSLPPLRKRSDFDRLVRGFIRDCSPNRPIHVRPDAMDLLRSHTWPGNLSELRSRLKLILALMSDEARQLGPEDIPNELLDDEWQAGR